VGVLDDADGANKVGLDEALKRYVEARPALKYTEDMASKTIAASHGERTNTCDRTLYLRLWLCHQKNV
jgi:hypothetical protein